MPNELIIYTTKARRFPLGNEPVMIGRSLDCQVVLADKAISRHHCKLSPGEDGRWLVTDLESRAGTLLDGEPLSAPQVLSSGSWLKVGSTTIQFGGSGDSAVVLSGEPVQDAFLLGELLETMAGFARTDDLDEILRTIVDRGIRVASGNRGALFLTTENDDLEAVVARDRELGDLPLKEAVSTEIPRETLTTRQPVVWSEIDPQGATEEMPRSLAEMPRLSVVCVPLPGEDGPRGVLSVDSMRAASEFGAAELATLATLASHAALAMDRAKAHQQTAARQTRLEAENARLRLKLEAATPIGQCPAMISTLRLIQRVAPSDATICLTGETGTGKGLLARYLHDISPRSGGPFIVVDCGALPETLIESELFGHEKGAFTGAARSRLGRLREADGGTVLLDEIGEIPLPLQTRLLRFLQDRVVQPIGGRPVAVDVRVLSATHRDLEERVSAGDFRRDLYYRLAIMTIRIPPLRERGEDVLLLATKMLQRFQPTGEGIQGFSRTAREALLHHDWQGNVRELEHRIQRAVLLATSPYLSSWDLGLAEGGEDLPAPQPEDDRLPPLPEARAAANESFERHYLGRVMAESEGSVSRAAELAGVSRQALHALLKRHPP